MAMGNEQFNASLMQKHLHDYIIILLRRWKAFTLSFCAIFLGGAMHTLSLPPIYEASTTFRVNSGKSALGMPWESTFNSSNPIDTEIEMLKSRTYAEQVAKRLHMEIQEASRIRSGIKPEEIGRTGIIRLSYRDTVPNVARDVVNTMAQLYIEQDVALRSQEAVKSMEFIEEQIKKVREEMDKAENELQAYRVSSEIFSLDSETEKIIEKLTEIERKKTEISLQKKQIEFSIASLKESTNEGRPFYPSDPTEAAMAVKLSDLMSQIVALKAEYTEAHPQVRAIQRQIEEVKRSLQGFYDSRLQNLVRQEEYQSELQSRHESELKKLPDAEREMARLMRHTKVNADIYTLLLQKYEERRLAKAATVSNIHIIDPALTPVSPVAPNKRKNMILGFWLSFMAGVGLVFFLEYLDDTIKDEESAKHELELPLLATVPHIPLEEGGEISLHTYLEPKSAISESFRNLRTNIHFSAINKKKQVLMLTSSFPGEGKSTITGNLAAILSQTGARVLLLDCDLRRPSIHKKFGFDKAPGITELLAGDGDIDSLIRNTGIPGLDAISAGTIPPNPSELLGSDAMRGFIQLLRERYDTVLIDAPPVLGVSDPMILATMSDMVIVVLELGRVPLKAAHGMRELLDNVGATVAGLVVNDKVGSSVRYGYYGYRYGYRYGGYYGYGSEDENKRKGWLQRWLKL